MSKGGGAAGAASVDAKYRRLTQYQHVLERPDTYVGSLEPVTERLWLLDERGDGAPPRMVEREATYVPGLYKVFDELLVNASDNYQRDPAHTTMIKVDIDVARNRISVYNNGEGIPVQMHRKEKMWVPELIFGHLLTSSNFDDADRKVVGGRNGYGAKLCNIFSTRFEVETADAAHAHKRYKQVWTHNMRTCGKASVREHKAATSWTRITFEPDLAKFGMRRLDDNDTLALLRKRVYDVAGCLGKVSVQLNGAKVLLANFWQYCQLYAPSGDDDDDDDDDAAAPVKLYERVDERWEVAVMRSHAQRAQQVSFVNGINTTKGGTHVAHVLNRLVPALCDAGSTAATPLKPTQVRAHLFVFINCLIENPAFDSQTKDTLTLPASKFGSRCELSDAFVKRVVRQSGVVAQARTHAEVRERVRWERSGASGPASATSVTARAASGAGDDAGLGVPRRRITGLPKLDDANLAGSRRSAECTLIVTEGDSAKALAQAGIAAIGGADVYGAYPIRGKLLNVRVASAKQLRECEEINALITVLGLRKGKVYASAADMRTLRYGRLMLMADQDHDGSHIKGLMINMLRQLWPSLLATPGFLCEFVTPIVKATRRGGAESRAFYTMPQFSQWRDGAEGGGGSGWQCKYYKGLGTSTNREATEYFSRLGEHRIDFAYTKKTAAAADAALALAFAKDQADERKRWLAEFDRDAYVDHSRRTLDISTFVHRELVFFSNADNERSLPSVVDGLKPVQRKVLYVCLRRRMSTDVKVAQLAGMVANEAAYHHGEESVANAIINMAQTYVGANNLNLLWPSGQFGTRRKGGNDHAAARYIYTRLSSVTRALFPAVDDAVLRRATDDDGTAIEPVHYAPVLPLLLINGAYGIGTGWSSDVLQHNPRDVLRTVRARIAGDAAPPLVPWYRGFTGAIEPDDDDDDADDDGAQPTRGYTTYGRVVRVSDRVARIEELPVGKWTENYKKWLDDAVAGVGAHKRRGAWVVDIHEHHTIAHVRFDVCLAPSAPPLPPADDTAALVKLFALAKRLHANKYVAFAADGRIVRYRDAEALLDAWLPERRACYVRRKAHLVAALERTVSVLSNRARFVLAVVDGTIEVRNRKKRELLTQLVKLKFDRCPRLATTTTTTAADAAEPASSAATAATTPAQRLERDARDYDYLVSMPLWTLVRENVDKLRAELERKRAELDALKRSTIETLWSRDLDALETALARFDAELAEANQNPSGGGGAQRKRVAAAAKLAAKRPASAAKKRTMTGGNAKKAAAAKKKRAAPSAKAVAAAAKKKRKTPIAKSKAAKKKPAKAAVKKAKK